MTNPFSRLALLSFFAVVEPITVAEAQPRVVTRGPERQEIVLQVGEQTSLPSRGVESYSEGVPGIVDVRLPRDGSQFVIVALRAGSTTLLLLMEDGQQVQYRITVADANAVNTSGTVAQRDNVRLDFYFVQVTDNYNHDLGIAWPQQIGGEGIAAATLNFDLTGGLALGSADAVIQDHPLPRLDLMQSTGWGKIMRHVTVVTANGTDATFQSGGEVNVPVTSGLAAKLERIEFGSHVRVVPHYDSNSGRIELLINADVSDLTAPSGGVPGRLTSSVTTVVNLELGQSVALAGLISETESRGRSGLPGLSQIPILGLLFGTDVQRDERTRNVLIIVPTVVDSVSPSNATLVRDVLAAYGTFDGDTVETTLLPAAPAEGAAEPASSAPAAGELPANEPASVPDRPVPARASAPTVPQPPSDYDSDR